MDNYKVYKHIFPNNKIYIGVTSLLKERRWQLGKGYKRQIFLYNAIQKYGWENIKHEVIFENLTKEEAEQKEIELIKQYKSNQREFGYNIESGGNINKVSEETKIKIRNANLGKKMPEYTKQKLLQANLGKKLSEETKRKISIAKQGKTMSEETKKKMSMINKGRKLSEEHKEKLRQINLGKKLSLETILKMKNKIVSQETREKMSKSRLGKPRSEEAKRKISESHKKRKQLNENQIEIL